MKRKPNKRGSLFIAHFLAVGVLGLLFPFSMIPLLLITFPVNIVYKIVPSLVSERTRVNIEAFALRGEFHTFLLVSIALLPLVFNSLIWAKLLELMGMEFRWFRKASKETPGTADKAA